MSKLTVDVNMVRDARDPYGSTYQKGAIERNEAAKKTASAAPKKSSEPWPGHLDYHVTSHIRHQNLADSHATIASRHPANSSEHLKHTEISKMEGQKAALHKTAMGQ